MTSVKRLKMVTKAVCLRPGRLELMLSKISMNLEKWRELFAIEMEGRMYGSYGDRNNCYKKKDVVRLTREVPP